MKKYLIVLLVLPFWFCKSNSFVKNDFNLKDTVCSIVYVKNELMQKCDSNIIKPFITWDEFNYWISNERDSIPPKIFINSYFCVDPVWASEKFPIKTISYKISIQFVFGDKVVADNVLNPIISEEIILKKGFFYASDLEKELLRQDGNNYIRITTKDFELRNYLIKNRINLLNYENQNRKYLGQIIIKTYLWEQNENGCCYYSTTKNVIKEPI